VIFMETESEEGLSLSVGTGRSCSIPAKGSQSSSKQDS
jgi:hypothetical protein